MNKLQKENPKLDLLTGELIPFKSKDQYLSAFYCNRTNMIKHFKQISKEDAERITREILFTRIKNKNLKYQLSTVEARSFVCPSPALLHDIGIDSRKLAKSLGLTVRYLYNRKPNIQRFSDLIICDTREQKPLKLKNTVVKKLDFGDYAVEGFKNNICIERKSLLDCIQTCTKGLDRFIREIERAKKQKVNIVILVEESFSNAMSFNYLPQFRFTKCSADFFFSKIRFLIQEFTNIQFLFVKDRKESERILPIILNEGKQLFKLDLQYLYDLKDL